MNQGGAQPSIPAVTNCSTGGLREVYTVGQNAYGELAHGDTVERHVFTLVEACNQLPVVQVAAGNEHTLILTEGGDLYSSGYNEIASSSASGGSVSQAPIQVSGAANAAANNNGPNPVNQ